MKKKAITITDVAKHANVSKSTVSQYLNKRFDYMAEKTKVRIEQSIQELGYQPNIVARSLKQKSTSTIGVIVANILHTFSTQVIRAIEDCCNESDFHIIVCNADDNPEKEKKYMEMLLAKQVDGIIIFPTGDNREIYQRLVDQNYPFVFVDRTIENIEIPTVMLDNEKASSLAVGHFVEAGYERLGIITTSIRRSVASRVERINGYKKALIEHHLPVRAEFIQSIEVERIQDVLDNMLKSELPPQAILAGNDLALMEILAYVKKHSISIPNDLAIIGVDEVSFASLYNPTLTVISQPTYEMGRMAATLILEKVQKLEKQDNKLIYRYEPQLIKRESS